jgi:[pyruvate, water dikinase]-phosphate phosphotransferase / [pyruvate, water dikinase] kinase
LIGMTNKSDRNLDQSYVDRAAIAAEINETRRLCARHGWTVMDVTRRSVEETAAAVIRALQDREEAAQEQPGPSHD